MQAADFHRAWGRRIRLRRELLGLTQTAFAKMLDVHQPAVSEWERGAAAPRDDMKLRIAAALGLTLEELFPYPAIIPPYPEAEAVAQ